MRKSTYNRNALCPRYKLNEARAEELDSGFREYMRQQRNSDMLMEQLRAGRKAGSLYESYDDYDDPQRAAGRCQAMTPSDLAECGPYEQIDVMNDISNAVKYWAGELATIYGLEKNGDMRGVAKQRCLRELRNLASLLSNMHE